MKKVAVVYFSQTGNTEAMAKALAEAAGAEAVDYSDFSADQVKDFDALAFGCPAMGSEELDPDFQELWEACESQLGGKPVVLFGSYDWGTGDWMETWKSEAEDNGVNVLESVIANLEPDDEALEQLAEAGKRLAE